MRKEQTSLEAGGAEENGGGFGGRVGWRRRPGGACHVWRLGRNSVAADKNQRSKQSKVQLILELEQELDLDLD